MKRRVYLVVIAVSLLLAGFVGGGVMTAKDLSNSSRLVADPICLPGTEPDSIILTTLHL